MNIDKMITDAARWYRAVNKPVVHSDINAKINFFANGECESPELTVSVNGKPRAKLLDLIVWGSVLLIFLSAVKNVLDFMRKR